MQVILAIVIGLILAVALGPLGIIGMIIAYGILKAIYRD